MRFWVPHLHTSKLIVQQVYVQLEDIQHVHLMHFSVRDMDVARDFCLYVQHSVQFYGTIVFTEFRPPEDVQAQVDGRGIDCIYRIAVESGKVLVG